VALVAGTAALAGGSPAVGSFADLIGFGTPAILKARWRRP
jgi:hypothetical protein